MEILSATDQSRRNRAGHDWVQTLTSAAAGSRVIFDLLRAHWSVTVWDPGAGGELAHTRVVLQVRVCCLFVVTSSRPCLGGLWVALVASLVDLFLVDLPVSDV
ncbi:hypothetical protein L209DRAFT_533191 [Thermothelomyces heterothallicus CBS 203.75]